MLTATKKKVHNYSAGPCILPQEVFEKAAQAVLDFEGSGMSILEISHRSKPFEAVMAKAQSLVKELLGAPDHYQVVFLGGGASLGFHMIPQNYMKVGGKSAYANTGEWASRAIKESKLAGETIVVASSEDKNFSYIPKGFSIPSDADYFHFTSNNTIFGTQFKQFPQVAGARGVRHEQRHLQPPGERGRLRPDLCRCPEEHGTCRGHGVPLRSRRVGEDRPKAEPDDGPEEPRRQGEHVQHAAGVPGVREHAYAGVVEEHRRHSGDRPSATRRRPNCSTRRSTACRCSRAPRPWRTAAR